jgi:hypothetical protein
MDGVDKLVISKAIVDELLGVLARKFSRDADELARVAVFPFLRILGKPTKSLARAQIRYQTTGSKHTGPEEQ